MLGRSKAVNVGLYIALWKLGDVRRLTQAKLETVGSSGVEMPPAQLNTLKPLRYPMPYR